MKAIHEAFKGDENDVTEVRITAGIKGTDVTRRTELVRNGRVVFQSQETTIRRVR